MLKLAGLSAGKYRIARWDTEKGAGEDAGEMYVGDDGSAALMLPKVVTPIVVYMKKE